MDHIGFDVADAATLDAIVESTIAAGGTELMRVSEEGRPIAFVSDPDGYVIQLTAVA